MSTNRGLSPYQSALKRSFDLVVAAVAIVLSSPLLVASWLVATLDTRANGLFRQARIGKSGQEFSICKLRTMREDPTIVTTVTTSGDLRITRSGAVLRKLKLDELPQLFNVLVGEMSLVGPRPDVPGFADQLAGDDRVVLSVRPGITGPAALTFRNEEELLAGADDPERFNREVIWPEKVRINREYVENYSFVADLRYIFATFRSVLTTHSEVPSL